MLCFNAKRGKKYLLYKESCFHESDKNQVIRDIKTKGNER